MMFGFALVCFGTSIRVGGWLPWRSMLYAGNQEWADYYRGLSSIWTASGVLIAVVGLAFLLCPFLRSKWGIRAPYTFTVVAAIGLYAIGATGTYLGAQLF